MESAPRLTHIWEHGVTIYGEQRRTCWKESEEEIEVEWISIDSPDLLVYQESHRLNSPQMKEKVKKI